MAHAHMHMHARSLGRENGKSARLCEAEDQAEGGLSSSEKLRTAPRAAPKTPQKAGWAQAAMKSLEGESQGQEPVQEPTMLRGQPAGIPGRIQRSPCFLFLLAACKEAHGEGRTRIHQGCSVASGQAKVSLAPQGVSAKSKEMRPSVF